MKKIRGLDKKIKKSFGVCCSIALLLMGILLTDCSGSSGSDSSGAPSDSSPRITTTSLPSCLVGHAYSQQISVTGGDGTTIFSITKGSLPTGITLSSSGSIAGTTSAAPGVFQVTVGVKDAAGSDTQDLSLVVIAENIVRQHPYETIKKNPSSYYVSQEAGLCAATCFYMTMKYYGDHLKNIKTGIVDKDCPSKLTDQIYYPHELSATSQIATYLEYIDDQFNSMPGIRLSSLVPAAEGLLDESGSHALYGKVMTDNSDEDLTGTGDDISEQKRNIFLSRIVPFLNSGAPVLVHLWRSPVLGVPSSGHYILVIGYDNAGKVLYFMDPNDQNHKGNQCDCVAMDSSHPDICFIQKVEFDPFIEDYWYKSDDPLVLNARWDGNWVGFHH